MTEYLRHEAMLRARQFRRRRLVFLLAVCVSLVVVLASCAPSSRDAQVAVSGSPVTTTTTLDVPDADPAPRIEPPTTTTTVYVAPRAPQPVPEPVDTAPVVAQAQTGSQSFVAAGTCGGFREIVAVHFGERSRWACDIMRCESNFNPRAVNHRNPSRPAGLAQFLTQTWRDYGDPRWATADAAPPDVQIAQFAHLYRLRGTSPWACKA